MARVGPPRKPKNDWFLLLRGASSAERKNEWMKRITALAKVLENAAQGSGAQVLAIQAGVSVEDAVKSFLWPRANDIYWSLCLAGKWQLCEGDKSASIGEIRKRLTSLDEAYEALALTMCDRAVGHCDNDDVEHLNIEEEFRLLGFLDDEIESLLSEPWTAVDYLNKAITDIRGWMYIYEANGRGSLASIVVAELVAAFFDQANIAMETAGASQASKLLDVKFSRSGTIPANSYCLAVEGALIALEVWSSPTVGCPKGMCASSDNLGHQSVLSFGGSGSSLIKFMRFQFR
ncbi:hypothetical protein SAMN04488077_1376, partial [Roseovarius tolerans]